MMLAEAKDFDILHDHQFVMPLVKDGIIDDIFDILLISLCKKEHSFGISFWGAEKPLAVGIFTDTFEDGSHSAR